MSLWLEKQKFESLAAVRCERNGTSTISEEVLSCMKNFPGGNSSLGELLQTQQVLQAAIDSLSDPVVRCGVAGQLWLVNRAAATLLGRVVESRATDPVHEVDSAVRPILERLRSHVLGGKGLYTPSDLEEAIRLSSGEGDRYFLPRAAQVYETPGGIVGATVVLQDVT